MDGSKDVSAGLKRPSWIKVIQWFPFALLAVTLTYTFWGYGTHAHYDEWAGPKLYPALALAKGTDLYQTKKGPYVLTIYGPGSPIFYLPAALGASPRQCLWVAYLLNIVALTGCSFLVFGYRRQACYRLPFLSLGFAWLFLLIGDKTTSSLYAIHHDLPLVAYLFAGIFFLLRFKERAKTLDLVIGSALIWMAAWTKIVALPCILLPLLATANPDMPTTKGFKRGAKTNIATGAGLLFLFSLCFGARDLWFHLFGATNSYAWRECRSLFGIPGESLVGIGFNERLTSLFRISILYFREYWPLVLGCGLIFITQFRKDSDRLSLWLATAYFLLIPTSLCALAKFGGVENSLVFAHAIAFAALLRTTGNVLLTHTKPILFHGLAGIFALSMALHPLKALIGGGVKDTNQSPLQRAYRYLEEGKGPPVLFALAPIPNLLTEHEVFDSGEALTYSTMTNANALPASAGTTVPQRIKYLAFGPTPYSYTFYASRFGLRQIPSPEILKGWKIYEATPKQNER
jgi:hypothetical protein